MSDKIKNIIKIPLYFIFLIGIYVLGQTLGQFFAIIF